MDRKIKNIVLLVANLLIFVIIAFLFSSEINSLYTTPRYASILSVVYATLSSFFLCGFFKRIQVLITDERYSKLKDNMNEIISEEESFLTAYIESVIKNVAIEESVFRLVPIGLILGLGFVLSSPLQSLLTDIIAMGSTSMWVVYYGDRLPHLLPYGPLFFVFVSNSMIIESVAMHIMINTMVYFALIFEYELEMYER